MTTCACAAGASARTRSAGIEGEGGRRRRTRRRTARTAAARRRHPTRRASRRSRRRWTKPCGTTAWAARDPAAASSRSRTRRSRRSVRRRRSAGRGRGRWRSGIRRDRVAVTWPCESCFLFNLVLCGCAVGDEADAARSTYEATAAERFDIGLAHVALSSAPPWRMGSSVCHTPFVMPRGIILSSLLELGTAGRGPHGP